MKADASYSAVRGEIVLAKPMFEYFQNFYNVIVIMASEYGCTTLDSWALYRSVKIMICLYDFPMIEAIDEDKQAKATERKLMSGQTTYRDIYGADWRQQMANCRRTAVHERSRHRV